jgi:hypothetical protein
VHSTWLAAGLILALPCLADCQTATLQIRVLEGEGAVHPAGTRKTLPLTIQVTDEAGKPVEHATVSFHLPDEGPSGTFPNGLHTDISATDATGRARIRVVQWNRIPGPFQVRIVASFEQVRAGLVSRQYIEGRPAASAAAAASPVAPATTVTSTRGRSRWLAIAALAAGGATAGILLGRSRNATPSPAAAALAAPVVTIGAPTISLGKP